MIVPSRNMPWLTVIGVGEEGAEGLSATARALIETAPWIIGGERHLTLCRSLIKGEAHSWGQPFSTGIEQVLARRGHPTLVLASGDPFFYGVGVTLAAHLSSEDMVCLPAPSSVSLACARLGWARQGCQVLSVCGRPMEVLRPFLQPGARLLVLCADETTPGLLLSWLTELGFGQTQCHILEALGGQQEKRASCLAYEGITEPVNRLCMVALEIPQSTTQSALSRAAGLPDACFEHDGQLTKREVRAVTLSSLAPRAGELLWDIGGGCGSVSIEWMLTDPTCRAVAVERVPERAARIARNAQMLGVPDLHIVQGEAPEVLYNLPQPSAIFIGGGATAPDMLEIAWSRLKPGGRIVVNAVVAETEIRVLEAWQKWGGEVSRLSAARLTAVGSLHGFKPAMTVTQWVAWKPVE